MRWLLMLAAACTCYAEQWNLYTCMASMKEYVVGAKLPPSGVFRRNAKGEWSQAGHPNPFAFGLDYDRQDPSKIYLSAGNGIIRLTPGSSSWKVLTGSDVTEMRDVVVDGNAPGTLYFGYVGGIRVSRDSGATWRDIGNGLRRKYTEVIRVDRTKSGVLIAGTEEGIFRSGNDGDSWQLAGAAGFSILRVEQSPHNACFWLATTERGGLFSSHDCAKTFENTGKQLGVGLNLYDVAFDPLKAGRIAVAGWGTGVVISEDNGKSWAPRS
ncbi:MAG: hypothetical protein H7Y20_17960, partial [Bryobacteraceae bacterium]|nr:hypothetical protein [Bryobacteraceae bacterium]